VRGWNHLTIAGNLGGDPETRVTGTGVTVATFSVGVNAREKRQGEWVDHTEWFRCVCWGSTAEAVGKFLRKGSGAFVAGRVRTETWKDQDGNDRRQTKLYANTVLFLGSPGGQRSEGGEPRGGTGGRNQGGTGYGDDPGYGGAGQAGPGGPDDDIPF
jgi:single-strand DNA-binding protein